MGRKSSKGWLHPHEVLLETDLLVVVVGKETRYIVTLTQEQIILNSSGGNRCFGSSETQISILSRDIVSVRPPQQERKDKKKKNKELASELAENESQVQYGVAAPS